MKDYSRLDTTRTLKKELRKPERISFLRTQIAKVKESSNYTQYLNAKKEFGEVSEKLFELKKVYPTESHIQHAPLEVRKVSIKLKKRANYLRSLLLKLKPFSDDLKDLESKLRDLTEDTRMSFFVDAAKGYVDRDTFIEIWAKANQMYEDSIPEICNKTLDELRK